jgi:hypothetical protein
LAELAQPILERAPLAITLQPFFGRETGDKEKVVRFEEELAGLRVGIIDSDQDHALRVPPRLGLIHPQLDTPLAALLRRASHRPPQMRGRQILQARIAF